MSKPVSPVVVGTFLVVGLAILVVALLALGAGRLFRDRAELVVYFRENVSGLDIGAPVKFKGITIGQVKDIRISLSQTAIEPGDLRIPVIIEIDEDRLAARGAAALDLEEPGVLDRLIELGLRATLGTESLLTGKRYVALDFRRDSKIELVGDPSVNYREIPSLEGWGTQFQRDVEKLISQLSEADVAGLARQLTRASGELEATLRETRAVVAAYGPRGRVGREVTAATRDVARMSARAASAMTAVDQLVQPDGVLALGLDDALAELRAAARSLRLLGDQLGRDPGQIVRGGKR
ncbi:MAG TPA: MlaD family protein [Kofleriaceae bacterium]|jgi:paraquat-inducible protein B|nr:MlaD family protein [Kofleriaceae bacterium]